MVRSALLTCFLILCSLSVSANPNLDVPQIRAQVKSFILLDALTGEVLAESKADQPMPPASLTKLMTLYIAAQKLASNNIALNNQTKVSTKAWKTGGSRMFIEAGKMVSLGDLVRGIATVSGNDASVALAEHIAGSSEKFVDLMNERAAVLGMSNTNFTNVTGLPDEQLYSSARDIALLSRKLVNNFPDFYKEYFSQKKFTYNDIKQLNRNKLLWTPKLGVDGLKTGHTEESGYSMAVSAVKDNMRLIAVVYGAPSENIRSRDTERILNWGFRYFRPYNLYNALETLTTHRIWMGTQQNINLGVAESVDMTIVRTKDHQVSVRVQIIEYLKAPVTAGQKVGELVVYAGKEEHSRHNLISLESVEQGGIFSRFADWISLQFHRLLD